MCGLFAHLSPEIALEPARIRDALIALRPRGPDGQGCWKDEASRAVLAHTRLSIISPNDGAQPISNEEGDIVAVVNGEFYGHEAIRAALRAAGHVFRTGSDSEILVHLYEEHGHACLEHLRGEFVFVLWDGRRRRLFAARDRFGIKPLVYATHRRAIYLASDAKTLFAAGVPAFWDRQGVYAQLLAYRSPERSLFRGVTQLPPGWMLDTDGDRIITRPYWDLDYPAADERAASAVDDDDPAAQGRWVEEFDHRFTEAVRLRLRADVPIACMLSGGIDSAAVLATCGRDKAKPIPDTFTVRFEDEQFDEGPAAAAVAACTGSRWHGVPVDEGQLIEHLPASVAAGEGPALNGHAVARFLLARAISKAGYRVALAGDGADDVLGGYIYALMDAQAISKDGGAARNAPVPELLKDASSALGFLPSWLRAGAIARSPFYTLMSAEFASDQAGSQPYRELIDQCSAARGLVGRHPLHQSLYLWCKSILPNYALAGEKLEMAHGVEVRLPFLDHHLFDTIRRLPVGLLVKHGEQKRVLREMLKRLLPAAICDRPKRPFAAAPSTMQRASPLVSLMITLLEEPDARPPFFDVAAIRRLHLALPSLDAGTLSRLDPIVHTIAGLCLMQRHFKLAP